MKIYILGVGALGSNIAMNLAFDRRDDELILVDFDKIEARNYQFGTQQYFPEQNGLNKVEALQFNIYRFAKNTKVEIKNERFGDNSSCFPSSLLIDCFDNYESREKARVFSELGKFNCLHIGFSPQMTFACEWNEDYRTYDDLKTDFDICEAEGARSFIQYVSGIATNIIIDYLKKGEKRSCVGNRYSIQEIK